MKQIRNKKESEERLEYYLLDVERTIGNNKAYFWKGNKHGYTSHLEHAGIFPEDLARKICESDHDKTTVMISTKKVFSILGMDMKPHEGTTIY